MKTLFLSLLIACPSALSAAPSVVGSYPLSGLLGVSGARIIAADTTNGNVWVAGYYSENVLIIDEVTKEPLASLEGYQYLRDLAIDPIRGRAYISHYRQGKGYLISVLDTATRNVIAEYPEGTWYYRSFVVDPATGYLYKLRLQYDYVNYNHKVVLDKWNPLNGETLATYAFAGNYSGYSRISLTVYQENLYAILTRRSDLHLVESNKGTYYTADYMSEVLIFDKNNLTAGNTLDLNGASWAESVAMNESTGRMFVPGNGKIWELDASVPGALTITSSRTLSMYYADVKLNTDKTHLYAADSYGLKILDADTLSVVASTSFSVGNKVLAMDYARQEAYIASFNGNDVHVFDLTDNSLIKAIDVRRDTPNDISLDTTKGLAYVATGKSRGISIWDIGATEEKKFHFAGVPTSDVAVFPDLEKGFIQFSGYFGWRMSLNAAAYPFHWLGGHSSITGSDPKREGDEILLVQRFGMDAAGEWGGHLIQFDVKSESTSNTIKLGPYTDFPKGVARNPSNGKAYVALYSTHAVSVVNLETREVIKKIQVGYYPEDVALDTVWNRIYVTNYGSNSVSVIDSDTDEVVATIAVGKSPRSVAVKKKGVRVYVANEADNTISVINGATLQVVATLPVEGTPRKIVIDEDVERAYVANYSSASVSVIEDIASSDTNPPVITHTPITGTVGETAPVVIEAQVQDDVDVAIVTLTFWSTAGGGYTTVQMDKTTGNTYRAEISAEKLLAVQGDEMSYFIDATDFEGNGPPTGATPGTSSAPNTFKINRTLEPAWSYSFGRIYGGFYRMIPGPSAAVGEIRTDLTGLEIATGSEEWFPIGYTGPPGRWFVFQSNGTLEYAKSTENDEAHSSINLYDLDGDGGPEILGGTTSGNQIQAFHGDGTWHWKYVLGSHHIATPAVSPAKTGADADVFGGSFDKYLRSVNGATGQLNWAYQVSNKVWSSPAVADLDGDGVREMVVTSESATAYVDGQWVTVAGYIYCLNAETGELRWKVPLADQKRARASAALADLDGDGKMEVLIGSGNGTFYALAGDTGAVVWSYVTGGEILSSAAVGDLDQDGALEVLFGSGDGKLYALNGDGTLLWSRDMGSPVYSSPALAKRQTNGGLVAYVTTLQGMLYVVRGTDGALLAGASVGAEIVSSPVVADADGDGKLDIYFQDRQADINSKQTGDVFWAFRDNGSSVEPFAREWPMFRRDPAHTGVYPMEKAADTTPPAYAAFRSINSTHTAISETGYNDLKSGVTVQLTVQDLDAGLSLAGITAQYSNDAGGSWTDAAASLTGEAGATSPQILSAVGISLAETTHTAVCGGNAGCAATNQVRFTVQDLAGNVRAAGPFAIRYEAPEAPPAPPAKVLGLVIEAAHEGGRLRLDWDPNGESNITGYRIYLEGQFLAASGSATYTHKNLTDGATYTYRVSALNSADLEGEKSDPLAGIPRDLLPPDSLIISPADGAAVHSSLVTISGSAADAGVGGIDQIELSITNTKTSDQQWVVAEGTASFQWTLSGLEDGEVYQLASRATDKEGNVEVEMTAVKITVDLAPGKVVGLAVQAADAGGQLDLAWTANSEADVAAYNVYRDGKFLIKVSTNAYSDTSLENETAYAYRISAVDESGQEGPLADSISGMPGDVLTPHSVITDPAASAVFSTSTVVISGTAADAGTSGLDHIRILLEDVTAGSAISLQDAQGTNSFALALKNLQDEHAYKTASQAKDKAGNWESTSTWVSFSIDLPPGAVKTLAAEAAASGVSAELSWSSPGASDIAGYRLYKGGVKVATTSALSYTFNALVPGIDYSYQVSAVDAADQEGPKTAIAFKTPAVAMGKAEIRTPKDGRKIWGNAVTVTANATDETKSVSFQFQFEGETQWQEIEADANAPYAVYWNVSDANVATGTYRLRAVATDKNDLVDAAPGSISVIVGDANADIIEDGNPDVDPNKEHKLQQKVVFDVADDIILVDGTEILIPAGTVEEGEMLVVRSVPEQEAPRPDSKGKLLKPASVFRELTFASGKKSFDKKLIVTLPAPDEDGDGILDGTDIPIKSLNAYYYDETRQEWIPIQSVLVGQAGLAVLSSAGSESVVFETDHFTLFGLFQEFSPQRILSFDEVYTYPNPARSGQNPIFHIEGGEADKVEIHIYDVAGDAVHSASLSGPPQSIDDGQGPQLAFEYEWNVSGVGSGVYLYIIDIKKEGQGSARKVGKCAVIK